MLLKLTIFILCYIFKVKNTFTEFFCGLFLLWINPEGNTLPIFTFLLKACKTFGAVHLDLRHCTKFTWRQWFWISSVTPSLKWLDLDKQRTKCFSFLGGNSLTVYNENQVNYFYFSVITRTWFRWSVELFLTPGKEKEIINLGSPPTRVNYFLFLSRG